MRRDKVRKLLGVALSLLAAIVGVMALGAAFLIIDGYQAFGRMARGDRLVRMKASPEWQGDVFRNPQSLYNDYWGMLSGALQKSADAAPKGPLAVSRKPELSSPPRTGLRVTWLGHSTLLIEIDGHTFLTDPVWGERTSPYTWAGPKRFYEPPLPFAELPHLDAILIS